VVSHVNQHWLPNFLHEELMLWVFLNWVGDVSEVLVANESVQQNIIQLHEKGELSLIAFRKIRNRHELIPDSQVLEDSVFPLRILSKHVSLLP